jgi:hypothetical protein
MTLEEQRSISQRIYMRSGRHYSEDDPIFDVIEALSSVTNDIKSVNEKLADTAAATNQLGKNLDEKKLRSSIKQLESFVGLVKNFSSKLYVLSFLGGLLCSGIPTYILYMKFVKTLQIENAIKIDKELSDAIGRADELYSLGVEVAKDGLHIEYKQAEYDEKRYGVLKLHQQVYLSKDSTAVWIPLSGNE